MPGQPAAIEMNPVPVGFPEWGIQGISIRTGKDKSASGQSLLGGPEFRRTGLFGGMIGGLGNKPWDVPSPIRPAVTDQKAQIILLLLRRDIPSLGLMIIRLALMP